MSGCRGQFSAVGADEPRDQCQVGELTTGGIPWQPEAV